jgi:hypothetical protein
MSRNRSLVTFALLIVSAAIASGQSPITALDHFKCYQLLPADPLPVIATLRDQFDPATGLAENITFVVPFRYCPPVEKIIGNLVTPIVNPADRLDMYLISQQPVINREVVVSNQFGTQKLAVAEARILAVPSVRQPSPTPLPPPNLDHFKCYTASGVAINVVATLKDELQPALAKILSPAYFCNPVQKLHNNVVTPIKNPLSHLTCYTIATASFSGPVVSTTNQFGGIKSPVRTADLLCVPSQKLQWSVIPVPVIAGP